MSRYFIEQPCPKDILGKRRELPNTSCVGVEFGPSKAVVYLRITDRGVELYGDDSFTVSPMATNHLLIGLDETHKRKSRIVEKQHDGGDLRDAKLALDRLCEVASMVQDAKQTRTKAYRDGLADQVRRCVRAIQRAI